VILFPWLFFNTAITTVFAMITGIGMYAIEDTRNRLEARQGAVTPPGIPGS
jgi:hypothetical protein